MLGPWSMSRRCPEPRWFVGDPTSLARYNIFVIGLNTCVQSNGIKSPESVAKAVIGCTEYILQKCLSMCLFKSMKKIEQLPVYGGKLHGKSFSQGR